MITQQPTTEYEELKKKESELMHQREELEDEMAPLEKQLKEAKSRAFARKQYADPSWFRDIEGRVDFLRGEIKRMNVLMMRTQRRMGELRRVNAHMTQMSERTDPRRLTKHKLFVDVAKDTLADDVYLRLWQIVEGRIAMMSDEEMEQPEGNF